MGKIIISENVSLDGVIEDPTGDEGAPLIGVDLQEHVADAQGRALAMGDDDDLDDDLDLVLDLLHVPHPRSMTAVVLRVYGV